MMEIFFQNFSAEHKLICFAISLVFLLLVLRGLKNFFVLVFLGYPPIEPSKAYKLPMTCTHENNLKKVCLKHPESCGTREECRAAVEDGDY